MARVPGRSGVHASVSPEAGAYGKNFFRSNNLKKEEGGFSKAGGATINKDLKSRTQVIDEIIESELSYIDSLKRLKKIFIDPLVNGLPKQRQGINKADLDCVFGNVGQLIDFHHFFLQHMQETKNIPHAVLKYADFLRMYTNYVNNYNRAMTKLSELRNVKQFRKFLSLVESSSAAQQLSLTAYLIMPVQRIPRYQLLLRELKRFTPKVHEQYDDLEEAFIKIQEIGATINESKRLVENIQELVNINNVIKGDFDSLVQPHRRFKRKGILKMRKKRMLKSRGDIKPYQFYLFNDIIIWLSPKMQFKGAIELPDATVDEFKDQPNFSLQSSATNNSLTEVICGGTAERDEWVSAINESIASCADQASGLAGRREARSRSVHTHNGAPKTLPRSFSSSIERKELGLGASSNLSPPGTPKSHHHISGSMFVPGTSRQSPPGSPKLDYTNKISGSSQQQSPKLRVKKSPHSAPKSLTAFEPRSLTRIPTNAPKKAYHRVSKSVDSRRLQRRGDKLKLNGGLAPHCEESDSDDNSNVEGGPPPMLDDDVGESKKAHYGKG